jgi:hypothetical protein
MMVLVSLGFGVQAEQGGQALAEGGNYWFLVCQCVITDGRLAIKPNRAELPNAPSMPAPFPVVRRPSHQLTSTNQTLAREFIHISCRNIIWGMQTKLLALGE